MSKIAITIVLSLLAGCVTDGNSNKPEKPPYVQKPLYILKICEALQKELPEGWTIKSDTQSIVIARDKQVTLVNPINMPSFKKSHEEYLKKFGHKVTYQIVLTFKPPMTKQQFLELKHKRNKALKNAGNSALVGKEKWSASIAADSKHPLPFHFNSYFSVYIRCNDCNSVTEIYPRSVSSERTVILNSLSMIMKEYE